MGLFSTIFGEKKDWRYVKMISTKVEYRYLTGNLYMHLYESNKGNRKVEYSTDIAIWEKEGIHKYQVIVADVYHTTVKRWLDGRPDPEIPTYDSVAEEDTMIALKGAK